MSARCKLTLRAAGSVVAVEAQLKVWLAEFAKTRAAVAEVALDQLYGYPLAPTLGILLLDGGEGEAPLM